MPGWCVQCARERGLDEHDYLRLSGDRETAVAVNCWGCGYIYVDYDGQCVDGACEQHSEAA